MTRIDRNKALVRYIIRMGVAASQKELGVKLGYENESYFSQIINEKVDTPKDFINKLKEIVSDLNIDWLITGNGEMLKGEAQYIDYEEAKEDRRMVNVAILSDDDEVEVDMEGLVRECKTTPERIVHILGEPMPTNGKLKPRHILALQKHYGNDVVDKYAKYRGDIKAELIEAIPILPSEIATEPEQDIRAYIESSGSELERVNPTQLLRHADVAEKILHTSMFPTFQPEDIVFVRFIPHAMQIVDGNTYYIDSKTYPTLIRRVKLEGDSHLRLIAQNKQFADILMPRSDINNLGSIVGLLRMNFGNQYDEMEELRHKKDSHLERMMEMLERSAEQQSKLIDHICRER